MLPLAQPLSDGLGLFCLTRFPQQGLQQTQIVRGRVAVLIVGHGFLRPSQSFARVVLPLVETIAAELDVVVSVDTSNPALMSEAADLGAGLINDVRALQREGAIEAAAASGLPVCLMHMQGEPGTMQQAPRYDDVVTEVDAWLARRVAACESAGIARERLVLDPGFGFGKSVEHNLALLRGLPVLARQGLPLLVGLSRKSLIGKLLGRAVNERLPASLALAVLAAERGAAIIRTHDVAATSDALAMCSSLMDLGDK